MCVLAKVKVTYSDLKMLETIITEATVFLSRPVFFINFHDWLFTQQQGKRKATSLIPHGGQTFLGK